MIARILAELIPLFLELLTDERAIAAAHSDQPVLGPARQYVHAFEKRSLQVTALLCRARTPWCSSR